MWVGRMLAPMWKALDLPRYLCGQFVRMRNPLMTDEKLMRS